MTVEAHKNLTEALAAFQRETETLVKDATNPHFQSKFVSLDTMVETVQPILAKHGLTWQCFPCFGPNGEPALRYLLSHVGGDSQSDVMPLLLSKQDPQGQGSAITYGRRYAMSAVLNLVADVDDDGNQATKGAAKATRAKPNAPAKLTAVQRDRVLSAIADADQNEGLLFAAVGASSADELNVDQAKQIRALLDKALEAA